MTRCELIEELCRLRLKAVYLARLQGDPSIYNAVLRVHDAVCDTIDDIRKVKSCRGGCNDCKATE